MKRTMHLMLFGVVFLAALGAVVAPAHANGCTMAGVAGDYGYTSSGAIITPPVGAFAAVGHVTLSAAGAVSGAQTTSIAGNFFDETIKGTYTVNPDCTGSATVDVFHGTTLVRTTRVSVVWDDNQKEARAIFVTPGTAITINFRKMFRQDED